MAVNQQSTSLWENDIKSLSKEARAILELELRPEYYYASLDDATEIIFQCSNIIGDLVKWSWPVSRRHRERRDWRWTGPIERETGESCAAYQARHEKHSSQPWTDTSEESQHIEKGSILARAAEYLASELQSTFKSMYKPSRIRIFIRINTLYRMAWDIFHMYGAEVGTYPLQPPSNRDKIMSWYCEVTCNLVKEVRSRWEEGVSLKDMESHTRGPYKDFRPHPAQVFHKESNKRRIPLPRTVHTISSPTPQKTMLLGTSFGEDL